MKTRPWIMKQNMLSRRWSSKNFLENEILRKSKGLDLSLTRLKSWRAIKSSFLIQIFIGLRGVSIGFFPF